MKKLLTLTLALAALTFIVSCGGDEANPDNLTIDETVVSGLVLNAYMIDQGSCCSEQQLRTDGSLNTTYTTLLLTDGEFTFTSEGEIDQFIEGDLDLEIEIEVQTEGTTFSTGEYTIKDDCGQNESNYGVEVYAYWQNDANYYNYYEKSGTLSISGSGNTYTLTFDGQLYDYSGSFGSLISREEGCSSNLIEITGKIKRNFVQISQEVWNRWD